VIKEKENFVSYFQQAGIVALLLNVTTMVVGYFSARLFRVTGPRSISISIESGIQNGTLAISVAVVLLGSTEFAIAPAIYSLLMFFTGGVVIFLGLRRDKKNPEPAAI
jgi:BASS family bile acid:Na+ symporter